MFVQNSLQFNKPQATLMINRAKAADLGINMSNIAQSISTSLSGGDIDRFELSGQSYEIIPQLQLASRLTPEQLNHIYLKTSSDTMVALSTLAHIKYSTQANQLTHFQQLRSATLLAVMAPNLTIADGLQYLQKKRSKYYRLVCIMIMLVNHDNIFKKAIP